MKIYFTTIPERIHQKKYLWRCEYKILQSNSDSRIVTLGERGAQVLLGRECQAIERERNEEFYGYE